MATPVLRMLFPKGHIRVYNLVFRKPSAEGEPSLGWLVGQGTEQWEEYLDADSSAGLIPGARRVEDLVVS